MTTTSISMNPSTSESPPKYAIYVFQSLVVFIFPYSAPDIYTDKFIVQQLADVKWVGAATTHEGAQIHHFTRIFGSLDLTATVLDTHDGPFTSQST